MEQLNSKLYEKYKNLKKRKLFDEEWDQKRDAEIRNYQLATEDLIEELKKENERLYGELSSVQEQYAETEKVLLEESRKTKELSSEVGRLQILLSQKKDTNDITLIRSPIISPEARSKKAFTSSPEKKTPNSCRIREISNSPLKKKTPNSRSNKGSIQQDVAVPHYSCREKQNIPYCCRGDMDNTEDETGKTSIMCVFHALIEFLVGMKFSVGIQTEELCLSVVHEKSGYSFSLIWVRHEIGRGDLMYRVSSLGTLERVALDWMKEDMIFSMTMCPVFFQRISRVIGRG